MKYLKYFLIVGIFVLSSSYTTRTSEISKGISCGNLIPDLKISESGKKFDISQLRGKKVLVSFWAAFNAESHMKNVQLWNSLKKEGYQLEMVSISFDKSKSVFEKTLKLDGIDGKYFFLSNRDSSFEIYKNYRLESGFGNYLVDENGVIIAKDVTPSKLKQLL